MTDSPTPVSGDAMPIDDVIARLRDIAANRSEDGTWYAANGGTQEATTEWIAADLLERLRSQVGAPRFTLVDELRDEVANIVGQVGTDGLPGPRDLDVALDAIEAAIQAHLSAAPQPPVSQSVPKGSRALADELKLVSAFLFEEQAGGLMDVVERAITMLSVQPPEGGTGWPELPCRFSERGCTGHAVGIFHVPQGCHCWPDPIQALCAQHACKADSPGPIECVIDFSMPSSPGQDDRTNASQETDGSLNQSSALPRKDVEGAAWAVIKQLRDGEWCSSACLTRGGCGCADAIQTAIDASVSAEHSRVIDAAMKIAAREQYADWEPEHPLAKRVQSRIVEGIRDLGKQTGGAE